ncbi:Trypanosomal VSG domain containing protein, putative [Trypanosoma equiperdum]|uniref:Trypanosomal VSG domain containing protein, putative n=1 Tax=Trypanosoma equiperdum TaxID=5694 RepID=A0A1G4IL03_TRYEQ|nr:Trypanosomal VSG domain containing protein, putative [Trypanosoma equiperdum]
MMTQRICEAQTIFFVAAVFMALFVIDKTEEAQGDDSDNGPEFNAMCRLLRLLQKGFNEAETPITQELAEVYKDISGAHVLASSSESAVKKAIENKDFDLSSQSIPIRATAVGKAAAAPVNKTYATATNIKKQRKKQPKREPTKQKKPTNYLSKR